MMIFCRLTLVGTDVCAADALEKALRTESPHFRIEVRREESIAAASFPPAMAHAIVLGRERYIGVTTADWVKIRSAMESSRCCVYPIEVEAGKSPILDQFIQHAGFGSVVELAREIAAFFTTADELLHREIAGALRDFIKLTLHRYLSWLSWASWFGAGLHAANAVRLLAGLPSWLPQDGMITWITALFGAHFAAYVAVVGLRKLLFSALIKHDISLGFAMVAGTMWLSAATALYSMVHTISGPLNLMQCLLFGVISCMLVEGAFRARVECTSMSEIQKTLENPDSRVGLLRKIGMRPVSSLALELMRRRSRRLFVSYMHGSTWSAENAHRLQKWAGELGFEVFHDSSGISPGELWRKLLLRGISECDIFLAVIDVEVMPTSWVLAESGHAINSRKFIGKPNVVLVLRGARVLEKEVEHPLRILYAEILSQAPGDIHGAWIVNTDSVELTKELFAEGLRKIRPFALIGGRVIFPKD